jgi:hypothetical protein
MIIKVSPFKEPNVSLPCARKLIVGPYPEPFEFGSKLHALFSKDHFNVILSSACTSPNWWISWRISSLYVSVRDFRQLSWGRRGLRSSGMLAAYVYSCLPAFGGQPLGPIFNGLADQDPWPLKIGLIVWETSVNNYQRALRNNTEQRRSHAFLNSCVRHVF